jgi:hypothetical protein
MLRIASRRTLSTGFALRSGDPVTPEGGWKPPHHADNANFWNKRSDPEQLAKWRDFKGNYERQLEAVEARREEFENDPRQIRMYAGLWKPAETWETTCVEEAIYHYPTTHRVYTNNQYEIFDTHGETIREDCGMGMWAIRIAFAYALFMTFIGGEIFGLRNPTRDDLHWGLIPIGPVPVLTAMFGGPSVIQMWTHVNGFLPPKGTPIL